MAIDFKTGLTISGVSVQPGYPALAGLTAGRVLRATGAGTVAFGVLQASDLPNTAVTPGSYVNASITVDQQGRITAASSGAAPTVTGSGVAGLMTFWSGTDTLSSDSALVWDNTNKRLGIGTTTPAGMLHLAGGSSDAVALVFTNSANSAGNKGIRLAFDNDRLTVQKTTDSGGFAANYVAFMAATGNVGVGTMSPTAKLDVIDGYIRAREGLNNAPTSGAGVEIVSTGGVGYFVSYNRDSGAYRSLQLHGSSVTVGGSASVTMGIGAASTGARLYVKKPDDNVTANIIQAFAANGTQGIGIGYNGLEAVGSNSAQDIQIRAKSTGNVVFATAGGSTRGYFDSNGNLLTTSSLYPSNQATYYLYYTTIGGVAGMGTNAHLFAVGTRLMLGGQGTYFFYYDNGNGGYRSNGTLLADGNIYWGAGGNWLSAFLNQGVTTGNSPTFAALSLSGGGAALNINNSGTGHRRAYLNLQKDGGTAWQISPDLGANGTNDLYFYDGVNGQTRLQIGPAGNIGIQQKLYVGAIGVAPTYLIHLASDSAGKPNGGSWTNSSSDIRTKTVDGLYDYGLAAVRALRLVRYTYNGRGGTVPGLTGVGFVAQEVREVIPEMVGTRMGLLDPDDTEVTELLTVNNDPAIYATIRAVQELSEMVDQLTEEIQRLKARLPG